jgi:hypothetical protein
MSNEKTIATAATFKPEDLGAQLRDKIHVQVAELMPDEMWKQLVEVEVTKFVSGHEERNRWGNVTKHEPRLAKIVNKELDKLARERVLEILRSDEWAGTGVGNDRKIGEAIENLIKKNAGDILNTVLQNAISQAVSNMSINLNVNGNGY